MKKKDNGSYLLQIRPKHLRLILLVVAIALAGAVLELFNVSSWITTIVMLIMVVIFIMEVRRK